MQSTNSNNLEEDEFYDEQEDDGYDNYYDEDEEYEDDEKNLLILNMVESIKVFGDYSRLKILDAIMDVDYAVCDIADSTGLTPSAVSHHLKVLRQAKLVVPKRDGRYVYYHISDKHVREIYNIIRAHVEEFQKTISLREEDDEMADALYEALYYKK